MSKKTARPTPSSGAPARRRLVSEDDVNRGVDPRERDGDVNEGEQHVDPFDQEDPKTWGGGGGRPNLPQE